MVSLSNHERTIERQPFDRLRANGILKMTEQTLRQHLLQTSRRMVELGLNRGTAGNASVRCGDNILITPSALPVPR